MRSSFGDKLKKNEFLLLLIGLLMQISISSLFPEGRTQQMVSYILVSYTIVISMVIFSKLKRPLFTGLILIVAISLGLNWVAYFFQTHTSIYVLRKLAFGLIYAYIFILIIGEFRRRGSITFDFILGAVSGYLLIGFMGAIYSNLLLLANPGAIGFKSQIPIYADHLYYNFVILSTLGFGDITPLTQDARVHAIIVVISGQLYLTIALAMIVGRYLSESKK